jgi:2-dehydro-3-deoxygluconokinase
MRIACVGECMIELTDAPSGIGRGFGGDTLNTAIYLARLGKAEGIKVDYVTALGDDPYSDEMIAAWSLEGIGVKNVLRIPGKMPGLYSIRTSKLGERSFFYWRSAAAARQMFNGEEGKRLAASLKDYDWIYFSGITMGILDLDGRMIFLDALRRASDAKAKLAYDSNYRPRIWSDEEEAQAMNSVCLGWADLALPSFDDERALYGDKNPEATALRIAKQGLSEIVVKDGDNQTVLCVDKKIVRYKGASHPEPIDTTAAGDSFNAGYIFARMLGKSPEDAVVDGASLAYRVVGVRGAILPRDMEV